MKNAPVYRTEGIGEDWEGLKSMVSGSTLVNRDEILFIIGHNERDTEREEAIRALDDGRSYRLLLEEFYPGLRRTTFGLSFDVRPYTVEELPEIFETKPECLSQHEMYQLAGLYASREETFASLRKIDEVRPDPADRDVLERGYARWKAELENRLGRASHGTSV